MDSEVSHLEALDQALISKAIQRKTIQVKTKMVNEEEAVQDEPPSPATQMFHDPRLNVHIIAIMGMKTSLDASVIKDGLKQTLIKHPRFCSKLVDVRRGRKMKWSRTKVYVEDHVVIPDLDPNMESPDQFMEDYISNLSSIPLDFSKPLWELHLLNVKTSDSEATAILRLHHSLGDGTSLISLLVACTRRTSDPEALPSMPESKKVRPNHPSLAWFCWPLSRIWTVLRMLCNTLVDLVLFMATIWFMKDTETPLKGGDDGDLKPKRFVHRIVSFDDVKFVKNELKTTVNDVVLGVTQAGLSRYLNHKYGGNEKTESNLLKSIRVRSNIVVNVRASRGIQNLADLMASKDSNAKWGWGNWFGYIILPLTIALQDDPLDYIRKAKASIDRKKLSLESICTFKFGNLVLKALGAKAAAAMLHTFLLNTTLTFSNVVGPREEVSFFSHPIAYLAPTIYGIPQALVVHYQSYCEKMMIVVAVDPDVIPDAHMLCDDFEESLKMIKEAAVRSQVAAAADSS